jgi:hypothetical protein
LLNCSFVRHVDDGEAYAHGLAHGLSAADELLLQVARLSRHVHGGAGSPAPPWAV